MVNGTARFNGLAVAEFTVSFIKGPGTTEMKAKAAFVDTHSGATHGWTYGTQWSPETLQKLAELRALLELDMGRQHFVDGGELQDGSSGRAPRPPEERPGLGEHLADAEPA